MTLLQLKSCLSYVGSVNDFDRVLFQKTVLLQPFPPLPPVHSERLLYRARGSGPSLPYFHHLHPPSAPSSPPQKPSIGPLNVSGSTSTKPLLLLSKEKIRPSGRENVTKLGRHQHQHQQQGPIFLSATIVHSPSGTFFCERPLPIQHGRHHKYISDHCSLTKRHFFFVNDHCPFKTNGTISTSTRSLLFCYLFFSTFQNTSQVLVVYFPLPASQACAAATCQRCMYVVCTGI